LLLNVDPATEHYATGIPFYIDSAFYVSLFLALFAILFGTRHLDPNERHGGMVAAIAFESVFKLIAFIGIGLFVVYGLFDGFQDLFQQALQQEEIAALFTLENNFDGTQWFWLVLVSMFAFILLPRQFHIAVVENQDPAHLKTASWLLPLYLLLINLFVVPIAVAGSLLLSQQGIEPDNYVVALPLLVQQTGLAFLAALGGFSAATGMVIVATVALSIMISNNLLLPLLIRSELMDKSQHELPNRLLGIRRLSIVVILLLSYSYFKLVGENYSLVSIGLISFLAVAQFAPIVIGGLYWKAANRKGAIAGLLIGFLIWAFTLPFPTLIQAGLFSEAILTQGLWGWSVLRPQMLFGLDQMDQFSHAAFWSLGVNSLTFALVSITTKATATEAQQADLFVNIEKYQQENLDFEVLKRQASITDIREVLERFLGAKQANKSLRKFEKRWSVKLATLTKASSELINFTEIQLTGALGAATAKIIIASITKTEPITLDEMLAALQRTQEIIQYSKALEKKSQELEILTKELQQANTRLQELDRLKAEFISTVTHELRTPITSIKAFAKILAENPDLDTEQKTEFLTVLVVESERISRLINQVLDVEKIQSEKRIFDHEEVDLKKLIRHVHISLIGQINAKGATCTLDLPSENIFLYGHQDRLTQVLVNLLSNAIKFCQEEKGKILLELTKTDQWVNLRISNDGTAIPPNEKDLIFERFTQLLHPQLGKPRGSGLGLYISKQIIEQHGGSIQLNPKAPWATSFLVKFPVEP
jgi:signal transduction histidine kinase